MDGQKNFGLTKRKILTWVGIVAIFAAITIPTYLYYNLLQQNQQTQANPQVSAEAEADALIEAIAKHVILPEGEVPTVATVTDAQKLIRENLFKNVQNGDKVLIFASAQKAYVYRPTTDRVVDIVAVTFTGNENDVAGISTEENSPSLTPGVSLTPSPTASSSPLLPAL